MTDRDSASDDVTAALAILRDAGFPVERIRILPAESGADEAAEQDAASIDRGALLDACLAILDSGDAWSARDLAREIQTVGDQTVTRKDVNSVLSREGKDRVAYDRETYTYRLAR